MSPFGTVGAELVSAELAAAALAEAVPAAHIHDAIAACRDSGRTGHHQPPASQRRLCRLTRFGLSDQIQHVVAPGSYPPGPPQSSQQLIEQAVHLLSAAPTDCALITTTPVGVRAARDIGMHVIGYSRTPADREHLASAGPANCYACFAGKLSRSPAATRPTVSDRTLWTGRSGRLVGLAFPALARSSV